VSVNGIICLDKPKNITSFACCSVFRRLLNTKKIGHAGTLDPMATGVLPLLVGQATRALEYLPVQDKRYTATLRFGYVSDTQDIWGSMTATGCSLPLFSDINSALASFRGQIEQIPPMISAVKHQGVKLYELARKGIEVERKARPVTIYSLDVIDYDQKTGELKLDCHCSKGTYIRTLCADLGEMLGCGAVMSSLRRTMAAGLNLNQCITIDEAHKLAEKGLLECKLISIESVFQEYNSVTVTSAQAKRFQNGGALLLDRLNKSVDGITRVNAPDGTFLGLGKPENDELKILKLFTGGGN
jgi:tRNA pseudouridine55 synthase